MGRRRARPQSAPAGKPSRAQHALEAAPVRVPESLSVVPSMAMGLRELNTCAYTPVGRLLSCKVRAVR